MDFSFVLFIILAFAAILTAIGLLASRSTVYAALYLVLNFATVAVFYLMLGAPFIALAQVTIYAGAIMVLFLFVIMLLGAERLPKGKMLPWQRPLAIALSAVLLAEALLLLFMRLRLTASLQDPGAEANSLETLQMLGTALFNHYLLPFEITSVLLLVAMIGAIVLTKKEEGETGR